ncbi:hypothetical protein LK09_08110 [Microbacterium mangrovi]|uniref:Lactate dehydrogenase n=1 Tax=Microbacterium mangrovi TaxID=1348253 RepID=A0A0B2AB43_9MICO|nr:Ldh family oxidoreductase [Microbacterium mangrovi]KHK98831.1 hypothetical protein LK09_08110 [Microbacterium mangrovi]
MGVLDSHVSFDELRELISTTLQQAGAARWVADILAANCAGCERDGALSHGVFRVAGYVKSLESGQTDGAAVPVLTNVGPSFLRVDAANGFAQPALVLAADTVDTMLDETGLAVVAVRDSHHFSALWPDIERFAERGFVALTMVVGGTRVVRPRGAVEPVFGTNPLAFATPVEGAPPIVMDFATSAMSHGDLQLARNAGRQVSLEVGTGVGGRDTTDPGEILAERGLLPFGGHKGSALSLMVEVLAGALTGGAFSFEADASASSAGPSPRTGQLVIVIDPRRGANEVFASRVAALANMLRGAGVSRLPADQRYQARARVLQDGIPVTPAISALFV